MIPRCCPRKARHQWVFFLLLVCFVGVYLTYKRLLTSETEVGKLVHKKDPRHDYEVEKLQKQLLNRVHHDLKVKNSLDVNGQPNLNLEHVVEVAGEQQKLDSVPDIPAGRVLENNEEYITNDEKLARLKLLLLTLSPTNWKSTLDADEMILLAKSEFIDLGVESKITCREVDMMRSSSSYRQGYFGKKIIDYVKQDMKRDLVLKSVGRDQQLKIECMKMDYNENRCLLMGNYRLIKELVLFSVLNHSSIIRLEGFCMRGETIDPRVAKKGIILVTEAGSSIDLALFELLPWGTKVQLAAQLLELLAYLEDSPLGSLGFDKLHIQDFVMVNSDIKLVDLDNLQADEIHCVSDRDCSIREAPSKVIRCEDKICKGRNYLRNLILLHETVLLPLLKYSPESLKEEVTKLVQGIEQLGLTPQEVLNWFKTKQKSGGPLDEVSADKPLVFNRKDENNDNNSAGISGKLESMISANRTTRATSLDRRTTKKTAHLDTGNKNVYERHGNANYPAMMTMVMKNANDVSPDANYGATLYKKRRQQTRKDLAVKRINDLANQAGHRITVIPPLKQDKLGKTAKPSRVVNLNLMKSCLSKAANVTASARISRERRLLAHLGLKDTTEQDWKTYASSLAMMKYLGPSQLAPASAVRGGRFKFQFRANDHGLKRGEYIAELGPKYYHIGYLAAYHLDRILGLFHVPPTLPRQVEMSTLKTFKGDNFPVLQYQNISQDNVIHGIVTVPMPPVMKTENLVIEQRTSLVRTVPLFTRQQKSQLEYVLLWSLTKMLQPQHGFLGYKGHLVHFEADLAFGNLQKSLMGYFYNCKFPNTVYKILTCYKCSDSKKMTAICGLGFEVIRRVKNNGFLGEDIKIGPLSADQLSEVIDNSATGILQVVEQCIRTFSREDVLY